MRRAHLVLLLSACLCAAGDALAQGTPAEQAKTLFNVGAQAYEAGQFPAAVQAFQEAYRLSPRPGILFSIAQAHRKQYYVSKSPDHLRAALRYYREYLGKVEQGGRRSDAAQATAELEPLAARDAGAASPAADVKAQTRLMVSSQTAGATIALDGGKPTGVPLIVEIKPGKHTLRLRASGYFDEEREIQVGEGSVAALDIPLRERPGQLSIVTAGGAQVSIDGRLAATTPLANPLEVDPGRHLVTVTRNGYRPFSQEMDVGRGEAKTVSAKLEVTRQRVGAVVLLGAGAAGAVVGGVLAGLAYRQQVIAADIDDRRLAGDIKCPGKACADLDTYNAAKDARDELRRNAGIVFGGAAALGITGLLMFVFDQPVLGATARRDDRPKPASPQREMPVEVSAAPVVGPGSCGIGITGRF
jgi:hypothetical protein